MNQPYDAHSWRQPDEHRDDPYSASHAWPGGRQAAEDDQWRDRYQRQGGGHQYGAPQSREYGTRYADRRSAPAPRRRDASRWNWLLLVAIVVPLLTPLYNRMEPRLFGLPFFYWCQLLFAVLSTVVMLTVHLATKGRRHG